MDIFNVFLDYFKDIDKMTEKKKKNWDDVESVATRFIVFIENLSFAILNKWW